MWGNYAGYLKRDIFLKKSYLKVNDFLTTGMFEWLNPSAENMEGLFSTNFSLYVYAKLTNTMFDNSWSLMDTKWP